MLFNSFEFFIFFITFFCLYWKVFKQLKAQNILILVSSFFFYAWWDWRFLFLLSFSILLDYITGIKMCGATNISIKKRWLWLSISLNLGFL
ncbi:MAG TPA: MBOAT family protein, partial [Chitinophagales bacterium]|nr:MBOAT family protein [Chitinophagales bacterium]